MSRYFDRKGHPLTLEAWCEDLKTRRRIALTYLTSHCVSTVWLGLDYGFGDGPPLIFETMVFAARDGQVTSWHDLDCARYSTEAEALAGHDSMVTKWTTHESS